MASGGWCIECAAEVGSLAGLRHQVRAWAEDLGMAAERIDDLATLVTEAASNVIRYAYAAGEPGELRVELLGPERDEVRLVVRDWGEGIRPRRDRELPSMSMGLPIIGALSRGFTLESALGGGTRLEVRVPMW